MTIAMSVIMNVIVIGHFVERNSKAGRPGWDRVFSPESLVRRLLGQKSASNGLTISNPHEGTNRQGNTILL